MKVTLCMLLCLCSFKLFAQENGGFLTADIDGSTLPSNLVCKPGVLNSSRAKGLEISYQYVRGSTHNTNDQSFSLLPNLSSTTKRIEQFKFKLKVPLLLKKRLKVLVGYEYSPESFQFSNIGLFESSAFASIDNTPLKSNAFSLSITQSWNEKIYTGFQVKSSFNGDYGSFISMDQRYAAYSFAGVLGIKKDPNTEYGVGVAISYNVRKTMAVPFFMYNKTFNQHWGLETLLPSKIMGRFNYDRNTLVLFGVEYSSRNYTLNNDNHNDLQKTASYFNQSNIRAQISLERKLVPWIWTNVKFGYQRTFDSEFDATGVGGRSFRIDSGNPLFFKIGIFVSPPSDFH